MLGDVPVAILTGLISIRNLFVVWRLQWERLHIT